MSAPVPAPGETFHGEDGTVSTILPDFYDPNYEPPQDEMEEYARCIGIDPVKEPQLMWIALEGLRAPLPTGWRACETEVEDEENGGEKKEVYYFNFETGDSLWDHPMDAVFRDKVARERAKLQKGGAAAAGGGSASGAKASARTQPSTTQPRTVNPGSTKTIADALFGGNRATSNNNNTSNTSRLGSLSMMEGGLGGGGRPLPDVSDVLGSANTSGIGNSSLLGGLGHFGQGALSAASGPSTSSPRGPVTMKEVEANLRKRIEDEYAPREREEALRRDREVIEERSNLERALTAFKAQLDREWEADNNKTDAERLAEIDAEAKKIEEGWTQRVAAETKRVEDLEAQIKAKQDEIKTVKEQSVDIVKAELKAKNEADIKERREKLMRDVDAELAKKEKDRDDILNDLKRKGTQAVANARARLEADHKKQQEVKATYAAKLRATAEAEVAQLEKDLAEQEKALKSAQASAKSAAAATQPKATSAGESSAALIAAVEAEMAAEETRHKDRMAKLKVEYTVKADTVRSQIKRKEKEMLDQSNNTSLNTSAAPTPTASASSRAGERSIALPTEPSLSAADRQRLDQLEKVLQKQLDEEAARFEEATDALLAKAKSDAAAAAASRSLSAPASRNQSVMEVSMNATNTDAGATTTTSPQEQRAKDAENTRHILSLKQLETKHEQTVRQIREKHHKSLVAAKRVDPRTAANYSKEMTARKRVWLTAHPAPQVEMPELTPIPKMVSAMGDMPAVEPPDEETQQAHFQRRLAELKETLAAEEESAKESLAVEKRKELDTLGDKYRDEQLAKVNERLQQYRTQLGVTTSPSNSSPPATTTPTAHSGAAELAKVKSLEDERARLRHELEQARQAATDTTRQHEAEVVTLREKIAAAQARLAAAEATLQRNKTTKSASTTAPIAAPAARPSVVFEPDFVTYIANDAAASEEAALKAKYESELAHLKSLLSQETDLYEAAVKQLAQAREKQQQLPPPVPTSAATPVNRSTVAGEDAAGTQGTFLGPTTSSAYMLPMQTPPHSRQAGASLTSGVPLFASHASQPGNASLNASSIHPGSVGAFFSPHNARVPEFLTEDDGEGDTEGAGQGHTRAEPSPMPASNSEGAFFPHDEEHEARLRNVQLALRARRSSLRERQNRLETLREEWRRDMAACRSAKDHAQARVLKQVKLSLEAQARDLNQAVMETKEAGKRLKQEKRRYQAYLMGGPAAMEQHDVLVLLEEVANKTAVLERALLEAPRPAASRGQSRPSERHRDPAPTANQRSYSSRPADASGAQLSRRVHGGEAGAPHSARGAADTWADDSD